jgi:5-methylthioadenosine/S-adenosylhomocysteine deaminase
MRTVLSADWVLPVDAPPVRDGAVVVADGRIEAVGPAAELGRGTRYADAAIVPGFVNAHSHLEYAVYTGFGDGLSFPPWIRLHIERKAVLDWDDQLAIARLGAAESLASGITTTADYSFSGAAARACAELGLRATVYLEVFGAEPSDVLAQFERTHGRVADAFDDRVRPGVSPHAPYTVSPAAWEAVRALGLPVGTHLHESPAELEWLAAGTGPMAVVAELLVEPPGTTGIRSLAARELLGPDTIAAHCVHVDAEEIALLARHDVAVAHCPRSNAMLGCGVAPLHELRRAGIRLGLGTDSPASTPSFDLFEELRAAVYAARAREQRPDALLATDALELATLGAARALGRADEIGSLTPGKLADLTVVSLEGSPYLPWEDPAAAVVFGGSPARVVTTFVGGEVPYARGDFEWQEVRQNASRARRRMLGAPRAGAAAAAAPSP